MGMYVEEIGGWVDRYIFKPIFMFCSFIVVGAIILALASIPVAAILYIINNL